MTKGESKFCIQMGIGQMEQRDIYALFHLSYTGGEILIYPPISPFSGIIPGHLHTL